MSQIGAVIAVSSCKGGVGKSTTAVNLAFALESMGAKVGIFDADVYGPSLPTMVTVDDDNVRFVGRQIAPLKRGGVSLMSFGYVNEGSAVMRGPMVTQLLDQFLSLTNWGPLDYLILDMPPGTGDIQLTLSQRLNITAAVIVTTPQELSFVDVERGVEMFDTVNVPCIAVVENMAYYVKDKAENVEVDYSTLREKFLNVLKGRDDIADEVAEDVISSLVDVVQESVQNTAKGETEEIRIFGPGHRRRLSEQWGIEHTFSIPLVSTIAKNGDSGTPFILGNPSSPQADTYRELAKVVARETSKVLFSTASRPNLSYLSEAQVIQVKS
jgi:Mrp family chromosome partitioning ATPase